MGPKNRPKGRDGENEPRHWTHLLALLLHRIAGEGESRYLGEPELAELTGPTLPRERPSAEMHTEAQLAEQAFEEFGTGPVPARFGLQGRRHRLRPNGLLLLLKLSRAIKTADRLEAMTVPGALTVIQGRVELSDLERLVKTSLFPGWRVIEDVRPTDPRSIQLGRVENVGTDRRRYSTFDTTSFFEEPAPIILTQTPGTQLPPRVEIYAPTTIELGLFDGELLLRLLELHYPELAGEHVVRLKQQMVRIELGNLDEESVLGLLRLPAAQDVVAALRKTDGSEEATGIRLQDMVGLDEARDIGMQLLEDLELWRRGELEWQDIMRGLLLVGPPGTGKTYFAQLLAREGRLTFVSGSFSKWQKRGKLDDFLKGMAEDFGKALAGRPSLIFIDELDAFYTRTELAGGRNDSYDVKAITGLLEHLDGFAGREGVVVLAASNHLDLIDPAITRAGRFDRIINIGLPDQVALQVILRQHLGQALPDCDLASLASLAFGKSGADVAAATRMAGAAARGERRAMQEADLVTALIGGADEQLPPGYWHTVAVHEAGHAVVAHATNYGRPVAIRLGARGGETTTHREPTLETAAALHRERMVNLGGRAAEITVFGAASGGSGGPKGSDLARIISSAISQELRSGLGRSGPVWTPVEPNRTDFLSLPILVQKRIKDHIRRAERDAIKILRQNRAVLEQIADTLAEKRFIAGERLDELLGEVVAFRERPK